jgi:hypothetical protein
MSGAFRRTVSRLGGWSGAIGALLGRGKVRRRDEYN